MKRITVRTVRKVLVQSAFGKTIAVLLALGWLLPSYAHAGELARMRVVGGG